MPVYVSVGFPGGALMNKASQRNAMKMHHAFLVTLGFILTLLILVMDIHLEGGFDDTGQNPYVVGGVAYIAVVMITLWMPGRKYTLMFASLTTVLTILVLFFEPQFKVSWPWVDIYVREHVFDDPTKMSVVNRVLAIFAIWITATLTIQRKMSEEVKTKLSAIVESSDDAIIGTTLDGVVTSWNAGATRIYKYNPSETIGQHVSILWPKGATGEAERSILKRIRNGKKAEPFETLRRRKDAQLVNVSITFSPTRNDAGEIVGLSEIGRDITDRKKFEKALIEAKEDAERMSRLKSSFLTNMSHEIRTPLSGILGFASILEQSATEDQYELVHLIEKSGRRLLDTINSVLDLSMLESDSFTLHPRPLDVSAEVLEKTALLRPLAAKKGLELIADVPVDKCVSCLDSACTDRILNNLIGNAIKFTSIGKVIVRVKADENTVAVKVIDTGIGISKEFMSRMFNEFEQESSGMARLYEGTGLGLSITRRLVKLMGGEIYVESERGTGSTFTVTFPVSHEKLPEYGKPKKRAPSRSPRRNGKAQVLIVDDDPKMRTLLRLMLQSTCKLDMADDEQKAITMARENHYDVVLQDVNLGVKRSGIDVLRELRKLPHYDKVPVVAVTAHALPKDREHFIDAGFDEYISKPISEDHLKKVINQVLGV